MMNTLIIIFVLIGILMKLKREGLRFENKKIKYLSLTLHSLIIVYIALIFFRLLGNEFGKLYDYYLEIVIVLLYTFLLIEKIRIEKNLKAKLLLKKQLKDFIIVIVVAFCLVHYILKLL